MDPSGHISSAILGSAGKNVVGIYNKTYVECGMKEAIEEIHRIACLNQQVEQYIKDNEIRVIDAPNRESQVAFLKLILKAAVREQIRTGVPWQVTMAQAAVETGYGQHEPIDIYTEQRSYNIFGIKYMENLDENVEYVLSWTSEEIYSSELSEWEKEHEKWALNGEAVRINETLGETMEIEIIQPFRKYRTIEECFESHSDILESSIYENAAEYKDDPYMYLRSIAGTYATDSNYYNMAESVMNKYLDWKGKEK